MARLPSTLTALTQATFIGGSDVDQASAVAIHPGTGDVYVAGDTDSSNFPGTAGGAQPATAGFDTFVARLPSTLTTLTQATYLGGGGNAAFVARLTSTLTTLLQATFLGGTGFDSPRALAIHRTTGDVYVAGLTTSSNFPGTAGGAQAVMGGISDAYVARLTPGLDAPPSIPALSEWTLLAMMAMLLVTGLVAARRRRRTA